MFWITGANGLLGAAMVKKCPASLYTGREVDIGDLKAVREYVLDKEIQYIFNCAAFSQVDAAENSRDEAYRANVIGPANLSRVAKEIGAKLIHVSSDYVFQGNGNTLLKETDAAVPCNYYGLTKLEGEKRVEGCVIRTSALFGDGGKNFVAKLIQLLQTQEKILLTNDQWNRPTYAPDLADAMLAMKDTTGVFHFANQGVITKYELGLAMKEEGLASGTILSVPSSTFPSPAKRPVFSAFDTEKIEHCVAIRHWKEALREFLCDRSKMCL